MVRGGTYNQSTFVANGQSNVTIQNYPNEAVWFDGSIPVTGWTQSGSTWIHTGWTAQFDSSQSFTKGSNAGGFVGPQNPMAANPDQVLMDGTQLTQVANNPVAGQFAVNYAAQTLTVGSNPGGHAMRASNLAQAFVLGGSYLTLRGFGVTNYATPLPNTGAIFQGGDTGHDTFENLLITNNATIGLGTNRGGNIINHVSSIHNGYTGIALNGAGAGVNADGEIVQHSQMNNNNAQYFNRGPSNGGLKVDRVLSGIRIIDNQVMNNFNTNGIWTDENVTNFTITGNTVVDNGPDGYGIINELSDTGIVANNTISGSRYGYTAFDSGNIRIYNNTITGNAVWQIGFSQDNRWQPGKSTAGANVQTSAAAPWVVNNNTVNNNIIGTGGSFQFYALDKQTNRPANSMNFTINGNLFSAHNTTADSTMAGIGGNDNVKVNWVQTPTALNTTLSKTWKNAQETVSGVPMSQMKKDAAAMTNAVPLPADVAAAIGVPTGTARTGTFY